MTTIGDLVVEHQKLETAKTLALEYSRQLPRRPSSPYGQEVLDIGMITEAFRLCYEELLKRKIRGRS